MTWEPPRTRGYFEAFSFQQRFLKFVWIFKHVHNKNNRTVKTEMAGYHIHSAEGMILYSDFFWVL